MSKPVLTPADRKRLAAAERDLLKAVERIDAIRAAIGNRPHSPWSVEYTSTAHTLAQAADKAQDVARSLAYLA